MVKDFRLTIGSHFVKVDQLTDRGKQAIRSFIHQFAEYKTVRSYGQFHKVYDRVYAFYTADKQEYRIHRHQLKSFLDFAKFHQITDQYYEEVTIPGYEAFPVELPIQKGWQDREYQIPAIEFLKFQSPEIVNRLLKLGTGKGKSYCMSRAISDMGMRAAFVMRPSFIDKWLIDFRRIYEVTVDDVISIKSADHLKSLISRALSGEVLTFKLIMISNVIIQNWIKDYHSHGEKSKLLGWDCFPHELYTVLRIGFRSIDEVHMDFHRNFIIDLHTHVLHSGSMSATLQSDDAFKQRMYEIAYPRTEHHGDGSIEKYIVAIGIFFQIKNPDRLVRQVENTRSGFYSHHNFEQGILKEKRLTAPYVRMIMDLIDAYYLEEDYFKLMDKCVIYVASVDMATYLTEKLKSRYHDLDVARYVENDPYDNLMNSNIVVTNLQKAGTNVDIPMLTTVILGHSVDSRESNIQGSGRLRELKDGRNPRFLWLTCTDVEKQIKYHNRKVNLLKNRTSILRDIRYSHTLG